MQHKEEWKPIKGYEGLYEVSSLGNVRSVSRYIIKGCGRFYKEGNVLKPALGHSGYLKVRLCVDGVKKVKDVHRLVAMAFLPNPDNLPCVNHKDENKLNNAVTNLEWCDYSYNNKYGKGNEQRTESKKNTWKKKKDIAA